MRSRMIGKFAIAAAVVAGLACPFAGQGADTVAPGFLLLQTQPGTVFDGVPFVGVPLGTFNFGGSVGVQNVGVADTIINWFPSASAPSGSLALAADGLQLETAGPVSIAGGPLGIYFLTLQSQDGGPASLGTATVNFAPDTFSATLNVNFDLHFGALNGPVVYSSSQVLTSSSVLWQHNAFGGVAPLIPGVNTLLDGVDTAQDFHLSALWTQSGPLGSLVQTEIPEPGVGVLTVLGLGLVRLWQKRRQA